MTNPVVFLPRAGDWLGQLREPGPGSGFALGLAGAASVVLGLGSALLVAALAAMVVVEWITAAPEQAERLRGLGVGALVGLAAAKGLFETPGWSQPGCAAFTTEPWRVAVLLAAVPSLLAVADARLAGRWPRGVVTVTLIGIALVVSTRIAPNCFA